MNELYITDQDKDIEEITFDTNFTNEIKIIYHWSGDLIDYNDGLPVGVL